MMRSGLRSIERGLLLGPHLYLLGRRSTPERGGLLLGPHLYLASVSMNGRRVATPEEAARLARGFRGVRLTEIARFYGND